jgi:hypothetical protein
LCCQSVRVCLRLYCACKFQFASVLVRVAVQKMDTFMAHCAHVFECTERKYISMPRRERYVGLARTVYIRCICVILGREITMYTVMYGVYIRFWPTLKIRLALTVHCTARHIELCWTMSARIYQQHTLCTNNTPCVQLTHPMCKQHTRCAINTPNVQIKHPMYK